MKTGRERCRVWIVRYEGPRPNGWHASPPDAVAVEPAERRTMSVQQANRYVEAFNRGTAAGGRKVWAVALPVTVRYEGEPRPGEPIAPSAHKKSPLLACQTSASNGLPPRDRI
ncbi:MAG: hypothetical protein ABFC96_07710 [Thermoguttaceae bacterium]